MALRALLIFFFCETGWMVMSSTGRFHISAPGGLGGTLPAPQLAFAQVVADAAHVMPADPASSQAALWLLLAIFGLLALLGSAAGGLLAIFAIIDRIKGKREKMSVEGRVETTASTDGPNRIEFDMHIKGFEEFRKESRVVREEVLKQIAGLGDEMKAGHSDNFKRRRAMHREINNIRTAMAFLAGHLAAKGDRETANRIQAIIEVKEEGDE